MILKSIGVEIDKSYSDIEVEIVELYYLNGANVTQISQFLKKDKKKIIEILSDPYYSSLRIPYKKYNSERVKNAKKKN